MDNKEKNEEKELSGINNPDYVTDPDEREFLKAVDKISEIAARKKWAVMLLARVEEKGQGISVLEGCAHCVSVVLKNKLDKFPELLQVLLPAIAAHMAERQYSENEIASLAKRNTPAGN